MLTSVRPHVAGVPVSGIIDGLQTANFIGYSEYKIGCYVEGRFRQVLHINDDQIVFDHTHILPEENQLSVILGRDRKEDVTASNWSQEGF